MDPQEIIDRMHATAVLRLRRAAVYLTNEIKETLSEPAPRARVLGASGSAYYRATTPATPGAPPRKITGRLRASIAYTVDPSNLTARIGTNVIYGPPLEFGNHPFASVTLNKRRAELKQILEGGMP